MQKTTLHSTLALLFLAFLSLTACGQEAEKNKLQTKVYEVPQTFGDYIKFDPYNASGAPRDPFAPPPEPDETEPKPKQKPSAKSALEKLGVTFGEGADASYDKAKSHLTVTNFPEQLEIVELILDQHRDVGAKQIFVHMEYIEVDHDEFSDWLFDNVIDNDGTKLRKEVQQWIKAGRAEIIESSTVVARSGQRAKVESIEEYIYPTEYDPSDIPNDVTLSDGAEAPITPANPTAFETRNVGHTLEVDPVLGADNHTIDLNLSPEIVKLDEIIHWHDKTADPKFRVHMPVFYTMKITTQVTTLHGRYTFLGTTRPLEPADPERENPLVLQFVRGDVCSVNDWREVK